MNKDILKLNLEKLKIPKSYYSLNAELLPGRVVLHENYDRWEVFLFTEKGNREDEVVFSSEEEACRYIYDKMVKSKRIIDKYG